MGKHKQCTHYFKLNLIMPTEVLLYGGLAGIAIPVGAGYKHKTYQH
jgi:hypothetical protein